MIGQQQFWEIVESKEHISDRAEEAAGLPWEEKLKLMHQWWVERGVDPEAVDGYALWEAADTMSVLGDASRGRGRVAAITAEDLQGAFAATAEMALRIGWLLREKKYRADLL